MLQLNYEFTAMYFSRHRVAVSITPYNTPAHIIQDNSEALWNDIIHCFVQGRLYAVAHSLNVLPYQRGHSGVFDVLGPLKTRKQIFRLLTPYRESTPGVQLAVKIKFFRNTSKWGFQGVSQEKVDLAGDSMDHLTIEPLTIEHWAGRLWSTPKNKAEPQDEATPDQDPHYDPHYDPHRDDLVL